MTHPLRSFHLLSILAPKPDGTPTPWRLSLEGRTMERDEDENTAVSVAGEATAVGEDTFADADVTLNARDYGPYSITRGSATFTAAARGDEDAEPAVFVDAFANIFGADFVSLGRTVSEVTERDTDGSVVTMRSTRLEILAVEFDAFDFAEGPVVRERLASVAPEEFAPPQGNLATYDVEADAAGDDTDTRVDVAAITLEDQLSTVSVHADVLV